MVIVEGILPEKIAIWKYYESTMQVAMGVDFLKVDFLGKMFRILQWIVGIFLVVGLVRMRKIKEYWVFTSGAVFIIMVCLLPVGFSGILNITRFFHLTLFMFAPAFVVGGSYLLRTPKVLALALLIPYFLFTSGFIFEVAKYDKVESHNLPYNIALSNHRLDLGATFTENDIKVRDWAVDNEIGFPLYTDFFGSSFVGERVGYRWDLLSCFPKYPQEIVAPPYYVFIRERNVWDGGLSIWKGIGCRKLYPFSDYYVDINKNIIYQAGEARIIYVEGKD